VRPNRDSGSANNWSRCDPIGRSAFVSGREIPNGELRQLLRQSIGFDKLGLLEDRRQHDRSNGLYENARGEHRIDVPPSAATTRATAMCVMSDWVVLLPHCGNADRNLHAA